MKSPAFQWYPTDYFGSQRVQMMTLEEEGAYLRLLFSCWQHGSIPADPSQAARLIGKGASTTLATTVLTMFQASAEQGRMIHDRLERERSKQAEWRAKSSEGGKKSAEMREKAKGASTTVQPPLQPNTQPTGNSSVFRLPSSDSVSISEHPKPSPAATDPTPAEVIYGLYPKKVAKKAALKAIATALKFRTMAQLSDSVLAYAMATSDWPAKDRRFIPNPASWFNDGHYDDDRSEWAPKESGKNETGVMSWAQPA